MEGDRHLLRAPTIYRDLAQSHGDLCGAGLQTQGVPCAQACELQSEGLSRFQELGADLGGVARIGVDLEARGAMGPAHLVDKLAPEKTLLDDIAVKLEVLAKRSESSKLEGELLSIATQARKRQLKP